MAVGDADITVIVGRTPSGFERWLRERGLRVPEPEWLGEKVADMTKAFMEGDRALFFGLVMEVVLATGAHERGPRLAGECARQVMALAETGILLCQALKAAAEQEGEGA